MYSREAEFKAMNDPSTELNFETVGKSLHIAKDVIF